MEFRLCFLFCVLFIHFTQASFFNPYPRLETHDGDEDLKDDKPLFITPFLEQSKNVQDIQKMAAVHHPQLKKFPSYSGFFTVNKTTEANMFMWYFPAVFQAESAPLVLWLQGGPGASSLFALFTENGPFFVRHSGKVLPRRYSWNVNHNLLYIDNPVGTGFSFVNKDEGYARNEEDVGRDLYEALRQFFLLFPNLQSNEFYITGESYAGKYIPAIAYTIHKNNPHAKIRMNLKGMAIGNGWCDPINQMVYGDYLYQLGLIDSNALQLFHKYEAKTREYISKKDFGKASKISEELIDSLFTNLTGFTSYYNYLRTGDDDADVAMTKFLKRSDVRRAIHVGNLTFHGLDGETNKVYKYLTLDIMDSVAPYLTELLSHYKVLFYNGQLDIIVAYPLTINFLKKLKFKNSEDYKKAKRNIWKVGQDVAGYAHVAGNLVEVLVRNAGHMVPHDQPKWTFDLITRLTKGKYFD